MTTTGFENLTLIPLNGRGPEDVVLDESGGIFTGLDDGRIIRVSDGGNRIDTLARTQGRPLGIEFYGEDELLVCASDQGLLAVSSSSGGVRTLAETVDGQRILGCNNAAVAADGTVYFTDSSQRFPIPEFRADLIEQTATGRVLRRDPDGTVMELLGGLQFANGVALAADESFVAVAETGASRIHKVHLTGNRAGRSEVLTQGIDGYPDNLSTGSDGMIWVAVPSPSVAALPVVQRMPAVVRAFVRRLPESLQPSPGGAVSVLGLDDRGEVVRQYREHVDGFSMLTGVREYGGNLYCGSLTGAAIAVAAR